MFRFLKAAFLHLTLLLTSFGYISQDFKPNIQHRTFKPSDYFQKFQVQKNSIRKNPPNSEKQQIVITRNQNRYQRQNSRFAEYPLQYSENSIKSSEKNSVDFEYPEGYFPFEQMPTKKPPKVRKPPYGHDYRICPGLLESDNGRKRSLQNVCGDLNSGILPPNPMHQKIKGNDYPFELIKSSTLAFFSKTLPVLRADETIPKVAKYLQPKVTNYLQPKSRPKWSKYHSRSDPEASPFLSKIPNFKKRKKLSRYRNRWRNRIRKRDISSSENLQQNYLQKNSSISSTNYLNSINSTNFAHLFGNISNDAHKPNNETQKIANKFQKSTKTAIKKLLEKSSPLQREVQSKTTQKFANSSYTKSKTQKNSTNTMSKQTAILKTLPEIKHKTSKNVSKHTSLPTTTAAPKTLKNSQQTINLTKYNLKSTNPKLNPTKSNSKPEELKQEPDMRQHKSLKYENFANVTRDIYNYHQNVESRIRKKRSICHNNWGIICLLYNVMTGRRKRSSHSSHKFPRRRKDSHLITPSVYHPLTPCPSMAEYVTPVYARNHKGVWRYVVQIPYEGYFTQTIEITKCLTNKCHYMSGSCLSSPRWVSLLVAEIYYPDLLFENRASKTRNTSTLYKNLTWAHHVNTRNQMFDKKSNHCDDVDEVGCLQVRLYYDWFLVPGACKCWRQDSYAHFAIKN